MSANPLSLFKTVSIISNKFHVYESNCMAMIFGSMNNLNTSLQEYAWITTETVDLGELSMFKFKLLLFKSSKYIFVKYLED